jgi:Flp pilus assembly protein TadG
MRRGLPRDERGVTLVLMVLVMALVLGMAALTIDYGMVKSEKAEAQRAVDASALAGASSLIVANPAYDKAQGARDTASKYALLHNVGLRPIVAAEVTIVPDLVANTVQVTWQRPGIHTWFASSFGVYTVGLTATATAHVDLSSTASCVKPVAIPDMWNNRPHIVKGKETEDLNGNHALDYNDKNGNGIWNEGETEQWTFDASLGDTYAQGTDGYGTSARDAYGTGNQHKVQDYGRPIFLMSLSSKDGPVSSFYYAWGKNKNDNSASRLAERITTNECETAELNTNYEALNGANTGPVDDAWNTLISRDASATWDDGTNQVVGSNAGANWLTGSGRVIIVGLYNPSQYGGCPSCNTIQLNNLAKVFVDRRTCSGHGGCKEPVIGRFLGFVSGSNPTGNPTGSLVKRIALIK